MNLQQLAYILLNIEQGDKNMQTIAFSLWGSRISPVYESSTQLQLIGLKDSQTAWQKKLSLYRLSQMESIKILSENNVDTLICGAISNVYANMIQAQGIELLAFISGNFEDVLHAYLSGTIVLSCSMPGCRRKRRRRRRGHNF